jgi:MFS family permease
VNSGNFIWLRQRNAWPEFGHELALNRRGVTFGLRHADKILAGDTGWIYFGRNLMPSVAVTNPSKSRRFLQKFTVLRSAPRELWIIYLAYILENLAYKVGAASVLTLWLSSDLGFGDVQAGAMIATWSAIMTLVTVMIGSLTDALGVRRTFLLGFIICLFSRTVMALTVEKWVVLPLGLYLQALGIALMVPVMIAAVKKYSNAAQRSVAFALYYALMNAGFAIGDWMFDYLRGPSGLGEHGSWMLPGFGTELSTYRVLILIGAAFTVPGMIVVWLFLRDGVEMTEEGVRITPRQAAKTGKNFLETLWTSGRQTAVKTVEIFAGLWKQKSFYRFLAFMTLVVGVRMIYYQLYYTFPKYGIRELGEGAPVGRLSGVLNEVLILVLVPICGVLTQKVSAYRMVMVGSLISALSVFFVALPLAWFKPLADGWLGNWVGHHWLGVQGAVSPLYISIFLFIVMLSVGEAIWSPRLYEYSAAIAPKGQEASYMALSMLPYFLAKFLVGGSSGWLLKEFCPETGPRHPQVMWFIIGCMALVTPVGAFLFRKYIQVQESGREPVVGRSEAAVKAEEDTRE